MVIKLRQICGKEKDNWINGVTWGRQEESECGFKLKSGAHVQCCGNCIWYCVQRVDQLKALGNAVVPAQVYPILKAIADIED